MAETKEREFAFDVKLWAVARVQATSEAEARKKLHEVADCMNIAYSENGVLFTEASSEGEYDLIEIDGEAI